LELVSVVVVMVFADVVVTVITSVVARAVARDVKVIYGGGIHSEGYQC
jgi:hypothetical protein